MPYLHYYYYYYYYFHIQISIDEWFELDFSWSETTGLEVYINSAMVASTTVAVTRVRTSVSVSTELYIGKAVTASLSNERTTVLIEDFNVYNVKRTELVEIGLKMTGAEDTV